MASSSRPWWVTSSLTWCSKAARGATSRISRCSDLPSAGRSTSEIPDDHDDRHDHRDHDRGVLDGSAHPIVILAQRVAGGGKRRAPWQRARKGEDREPDEVVSREAGRERDV